MSRVYFVNNYDQFPKAKPHEVLNNDEEILEQLQNKLYTFKNKKINILLNEMKSHIFCDNSVYTGSSGLAMYFFKCAMQSNGNTIESNDLLKTALNYINLNKVKGKRISFLCGDAGPIALAAVISYKLGTEKPEDLPDYKILINRLVALDSLLDDSPDELLYGKSGYLFSLLFVNNYIGNKEIPSKQIKKVINAILHCGKHLSSKVKSKSPLLWQWHDKVYLGGAHGIAGILYILLQAMQYVDSHDVENYIKPTLDWLVGQQFPSGNFPSSLNSSSGDRLVQWCHGAPGFTPLFLLAYQVFHEDKYLTIALQCGDVVWERGLTKKGYSICHGVSGNAYTFIQLYQATKEPIHLYRASCFIEWCVKECPNSELHYPDRPASLFEGLTGRLYAVAEFNNILEAKFPAFTI